jgi:putative endonuclease
MSKTYWVYILKCSDGSYFTGSTSGVESRLIEHQSGSIKGYTSKRLPVELVFSEYSEDVYEILNAERQIKKWTRAKKEALINSDFKVLHTLAECRNLTHSKNYEKGKT